jgi:hypothetical protein
LAGHHGAFDRPIRDTIRGTALNRRWCYTVERQSVRYARVSAERAHHRYTEGNTSLSALITERNTSLNGHLSSLDARMTETSSRLTKLEEAVTQVGRTVQGHEQDAGKVGERFRAASHPE